MRHVFASLGHSDLTRWGPLALGVLMLVLTAVLAVHNRPDTPPVVWFPGDWQAGDAPFAAADHRDPLPVYAPRFHVQRVAARGQVQMDHGVSGRAHWSGDAVAVLVQLARPAVVPPRRDRPVELAQAAAELGASTLRPPPRPEALAAAYDAAPHDAIQPATQPATLAAARPAARPASLVTRLALRDDALRPVAPETSLALPDLPALAAGPTSCNARLVSAIPRRPSGAAGGRAVLDTLHSVSGSARDAAIERAVRSGNVPPFLRDLVPVTMTGRTPTGEAVRITLCVTPDYLAVGSDRDFVRVPLGLPAAQRIASSFDMMLPTTRMVDAIHAQAQLRLDPRPMTPGPQMSSTAYLVAHNATLESQRRGAAPGVLVSGHKKDVVLTNRMAQMPGRVAIYGWHRANGQPIQPLSTVHGASYADYSHGVRLVSRRAWLNGRPVDLAALLSDRRYAGVLSSEGPIARELVASLR